jgi:nitrite reductase/ring-hydroxylating ferredoxin subunit
MAVAQTFHTVARTSELGTHDILPVKVGAVEMILYRVEGEVFAAQRRCLHQGADLAEGIVSRGFLVCASHGWRFGARTGIHEVSPETCLATYAVRVVDDEIQVDPTPIRRGAVAPGTPML